MSQENFAYLAGLVDGEGTITVHRHQQYKRRTYQLRPRLSIANNSLEMLDVVRSRHGGTVISNGVRAGCTAESYIWRLCSFREILICLTAVRPFLIVKSQHADKMIEFAMSRLKASGNGYSDRDVQIYFELAGMNRRRSQKQVCVV